VCWIWAPSDSSVLVARFWPSGVRRGQALSVSVLISCRRFSFRSPRRSQLFPPVLIRGQVRARVFSWQPASIFQPRSDFGACSALFTAAGRSPVRRRFFTPPPRLCSLLEIPPPPGWAIRPAARVSGQGARFLLRFFSFSAAGFDFSSASSLQHQPWRQPSSAVGPDFVPRVRGRQAHSFSSASEFVFRWIWAPCSMSAPCSVPVRSFR
jgi:hypothetical protein